VTTAPGKKSRSDSYVIREVSDSHGSYAEGVRGGVRTCWRWVREGTGDTEKSRSDSCVIREVSDSHGSQAVGVRGGVRTCWRCVREGTGDTEKSRSDSCVIREVSDSHGSQAVAVRGHVRTCWRCVREGTDCTEKSSKVERDRSESLPFWHTVSQVLFRWVKSTGNDCSEIEHGPLKGSRQTAYVRYVVRCVLYMCRRGDSLREVMSAS
jgi:RNA-binding protein YhbY